MKIKVTAYSKEIIGVYKNLVNYILYNKKHYVIMKYNMKYIPNSYYS